MFQQGGRCAEHRSRDARMTKELRDEFTEFTQMWKNFRKAFLEFRTAFQATERQPQPTFQEEESNAKVVEERKEAKTPIEEHEEVKTPHENEEAERQSEKDGEGEEENFESCKELNEKKESLVMRVCEDRIVLFSKRYIQELVTKNTCFLTAALKPRASSFSFEFLQEFQMLIKKQDPRIASKTSQCRTHGKYKTKGLHKKHHSNINSKSKVKEGPRRTRPWDAHDFKFALQGNPLDSRTNPFEEWEDDINHTTLYAVHDELKRGLHLMIFSFIKC